MVTDVTSIKIQLNQKCCNQVNELINPPQVQGGAEENKIMYIRYADKNNKYANEAISPANLVAGNMIKMDKSNSSEGTRYEREIV